MNNDYADSMALRDSINQFTADSIYRLRPPARYGVVDAAWTPTVAPTSVPVVLNSETVAVDVNTDFIAPSAVGDIVRIEGGPGDRRVTSVITPNKGQINIGSMSGQYGKFNWDTTNGMQFYNSNGDRAFQINYVNAGSFGVYVYGPLNFREVGQATTIWKIEAASSTIARLTTASSSVNYEIFLGSTNKMLGLDFSNGWQFYNSNLDRAFQIHSSGNYNYGPLYMRVLSGTGTNFAIESVAATTARITYAVGTTGEIYNGTNRSMAFNDSANYNFGRMYYRVIGGSSNVAYIESPSAGEIAIVGTSVNIQDASLNVKDLGNTTGTANGRYLSSTDGRWLPTTSWEKSKIDLQPLEANYKLLDLPAYTWIDKMLYDEHQGEWDYRSGGTTLEEVLSLNKDIIEDIDYLIDRGPEGVMQGLEYDRLAWVLLPVFKDMARRVELLESYVVGGVKPPKQT